MAAPESREEAAQEIGRLLRSALSTLDEVFPHTYEAFPDVLTQEGVVEAVSEAQASLNQALLKMRDEEDGSDDSE